MMNILIKCDKIVQTIVLKTIVQKVSARLKISPDVITQFQLEKTSDPFAKMNAITKITAKIYPIHTAGVFDVKIILKLYTRMIL